MERGGGSSMIGGFGRENNSNGGLCPMMMINNNNTLFLPLPPSPPPSNNTHNLTNTTGCCFIENTNGGGDFSSIKAKIMAHPHYHRLIAAYINCQKIGAPVEVVRRLEEACTAAVATGRTVTGCIGVDPGLDQFMEAYCEMLTKYEQELSKPFKESMLFLSRIECQLKSLTIVSSDPGI